MDESKVTAILLKVEAAADLLVDALRLAEGNVPYAMVVELNQAYAKVLGSGVEIGKISERTR